VLGRRLLSWLAIMETEVRNESSRLALTDSHMCCMLPSLPKPTVSVPLHISLSHHKLAWRLSHTAVLLSTSPLGWGGIRRVLWLWISPLSWGGLWRYHVCYPVNPCTSRASSIKKSLSVLLVQLDMYVPNARVQVFNAPGRTCADKQRSQYLQTV
jgi:hypothetical protein